jgi:transglutaminase-like putative cysteine protease
MATGEDPQYLRTADIQWGSVQCATMEVRQSLSYEYPGPIEDLRQVLILIPPDQFGTQRLLHYELSVSPSARPRYGVDRFGNRICNLAIPRVESSLQFSIELRVERHADHTVPVASAHEAQMYSLPSPLTEPTPALHAALAEIGTPGGKPVDLAERINDWVYHRITYTHGVTDVRTTAHDALQLRKGVCQDYSHLMIALCRLAGLPARYVSGHLLGEGAMHAWVQVLLPESDEHGAPEFWHSFDPTHGRRAGMPYIAIAAGCDFGDVSPTRGSFRAPYSGQITAGKKEAGVISLDCTSEA